VRVSWTPPNLGSLLIDFDPVNVRTTSRPCPAPAIARISDRPPGWTFAVTRNKLGNLRDDLGGASDLAPQLIGYRDDFRRSNALERIDGGAQPHFLLLSSHRRWGYQGKHLRQLNG